MTHSCSTRFIGDSVDYVLNSLIETTLAKDRDFVTWRASHPHETAAATSRHRAGVIRHASAEPRA